MKRGFQRKTPKKASGKEDAMEAVKNVIKIDLLPPRKRTSLNDGGGRENSNITKVEWRKEFFIVVPRPSAAKILLPGLSLQLIRLRATEIGCYSIVYVVRGSLYYTEGNGRYSFPATYCSQFDLFQCVWRLSSWTN